MIFRRISSSMGDGARFVVDNVSIVIVLGEGALGLPHDKELRDALLEAAHELCLSSNAGMEHVESIAGHVNHQALGLDPTTPEYADRVEQAITVLRNQGFLKFEVDEGGIVSITDKGIDEVEGRNQPQPQTQTVNIHDSTFNSSVVATQGNVELISTMNFGELYERIDREGGSDKAELRQLVDEVRSLVENEQEIKPGVLQKFREVMQRNSWITGPIASLLLGLAV